ARTERLKTGAEQLCEVASAGRAEFFTPPRQGAPPRQGYLSPFTNHLIVPRSLVSIKVTRSPSSGASGKLRPISVNACLVFSFARYRIRNASFRIRIASGENPRRSNPTRLIPRTSAGLP